MLAAARHAERLAHTHEQSTFAVTDGGQLRTVTPEHSDAVLEWRPGAGWALALRGDDPRSAIIDL
ncbi:MAG: hypothetical protein DMG01_08680, partial [Acidobacteria bacterium]